jgi:hypothetical protein
VHSGDRALVFGLEDNIVAFEAAARAQP